jgi:preprotein translocase subunit SecA
MLRIFNSDLGVANYQHEYDQGSIQISTDHELFSALHANAMTLYKKKEEELSPEILRRLERMLLLHTLDDRWKDHLLDMDHLREGINLRGYAQRDPILDYQRESFRLFESMFFLVKQEFLAKVFRVKLQAGEIPENHEETEEEAEARRLRIQEQLEADQRERAERVQKLNLFSGPKSAGSSAAKPDTVKREADKVGRNDPCPCGSGKKYKKCHGANSATG